MARPKKDNLAKPKLDLGQTLYAMDTRNKTYYKNLSDDEKKSFAALVLMRFMSSAPDQGGSHEYHLEVVNDIVNRNFWQLSKFPDLQYQLLTICGTGSKQYHNWLPNSKRQNASKVRDFFKRVYPDLNDLEFDILIKKYDSDSFHNLLKEYGIQNDEIKPILKQFNEIKDAE